MAAAITGGLLAVSSPATADAAAETRNVPGHQSVLAVGADDHDGKCGKGCRPGPPGPPGPPGARGRADGVDSAFATPTGGVAGKYVGLAQGNGTTLIRDPSSVAPNPFWHDISTLPGYPGNVTDVTLSVPPATPNQLHVTVRSSTGAVATVICLLTPNVVWPGNCGIFVNQTPPL
ncbi:hypothetical protein ABGB17_36830 [Sphaerisporangium sp. B11E5]|uniref:hypothetical protein n=1 Tax=Sphaerisporangium sp. B11E5 TaxID=3153563 RepID=UPI00325F5C44